MQSEVTERAQAVEPFTAAQLRQLVENMYPWIPQCYYEQLCALERYVLALQEAHECAHGTYKLIKHGSDWVLSRQAVGQLGAALRASGMEEDRPYVPDER